MNSKSTNDSLSQVAEIALLAELFSFVHIRYMHLNERNVHAKQCITDSNAGVSICSSVDYQTFDVRAAVESMQEVENCALVIRLERG